MSAQEAFLISQAIKQTQSTIREELVSLEVYLEKLNFVLGNCKVDIDIDRRANGDIRHRFDVRIRIEVRE